MRPYLAVIGDSFRSAFASRVLWVALAAIYVFLLALAPIGYQEVFTTTFRWPDFANGTRMKAMLAQAIVETGGDAEHNAVAQPGRETPAGRIARSLPDELQRNLRKVAQGQEVRIRLDIFAAGLNSLFESDDWYDPEVWQAAPRLRELRELDRLAAEDMTEELLRRRARLRIEAALPGVFESRGSRSIALTYAGASFPTLFQIEKTQFQLLLNHFVLRLIIDWVLGFAMIFLGILVTAAIIPDMLQPGSLHLLLSKPVSRSLLFLAKFLGGCAFVLVCVSQLIIGLWLISGFRLDVWNIRLLWCIPVCVFLFAVFYSVSAVAGLRWRSPILAIGLANLFGAACLVIGLAGSLSDSFVIERDRITGLTTSGQTLIASTRGGHLRRLDVAENRWVNLFPDDSGNSDRIIPPVTLGDGRMATARVRGGRLNVFGSGSTPLLLLEPGPEHSPEPSIELPAGTSELFAVAGGALLALNTAELMIAEADVLAQPDASSDESADAGDAASRAADAARRSTAAAPFGAWLPRLIKMMGGPGDGFSSILPERMSLVSPTSVSMGPGGDHLFVYSGGKIMRLQRDPSSAGGEPGQHWRLSAHSETVSASQTAWLRVLGNGVVLLRSDEQPLFFTAALEPRTAEGNASEQLAGLRIVSAVSCPRAAAVALLSGDGHVWILRIDAQQRVVAERLRRTGEVETLHWDEASGRLWLAHDVDRLSAWELARPSSPGSSSAVDRRVIRYRPAVGGWRLVDRYLVTPLRFVTPQTGELGETIATIVSGENSMQLNIAAAGDATVHRYNVWRPVLTCGGFILVMLTIGCVYFSRADF